MSTAPERRVPAAVAAGVPLEDDPHPRGGALARGAPERRRRLGRGPAQLRRPGVAWPRSSPRRQTAWALLALLAAGERGPAVERGIRLLVGTQTRGRLVGRAVVHRDGLPRLLLHQLPPVPAGVPRDRAGPLLGATREHRLEPRNQAGAKILAGRLPAGRSPAANGNRLLVLAPLGIEARALRATAPQAHVLTAGMGPVRAGEMAARLRGSRLAPWPWSGYAAPWIRACGPVTWWSPPRSAVRGPGIPCPSAPLLAAEVRPPGTARAERTGGLGRAGRHRRGAGPLGHRGFGRGHGVGVAGAGAGTDRWRWCGWSWTRQGVSCGIRWHGQRRPAGAPRAPPPGARPSRMGSAADERRVLLAGPRSFCAGVERAIEIVERALDRYGAARLRPQADRAQRARGAGPGATGGRCSWRRRTRCPRGPTWCSRPTASPPRFGRRPWRRSLHVIDATCPLVTKVHAEARRFAKAGYTIFLVGHEGHEEVEGTTGEAPEAIRLVDGSSAESTSGPARGAGARARSPSSPRPPWPWTR